MQTAATASIFSSLGRVDEFRTKSASEFSYRGLREWLDQNRSRVLLSLTSILPDEYIASNNAGVVEEIPSLLLARLQQIRCDELDPTTTVTRPVSNSITWGGFDDDDFGATDVDDYRSIAENDDTNDVAESPEAGRQSVNLLDRLFETASLPSYAFPTDVVSMTVFDRNRSTSYRSVIKYAPQQGLAIALSSYAPGREVFIDGKRHYSFAIHSPMKGDRRRALGAEKAIF